MFDDPPRTAYDLNFTLFGTSVRVHPFFWLAMLLLGGSGLNAKQALVWVAAAFLSILVHEFGHVLAINYYGAPAHIVLHGFGGLAIQDSHWRRDPKAQIFISLAGPFAGFALAALVWLSLKLTGVPMWYDFGFPYVVDIDFAPFSTVYLYLFVKFLLFANIYWGLLNLAPIYPLDGGQAAAALFQLYDYRDGLRKALILSLATAVMLGIYGITHQWNLALIFFGYLAYQNYVMLQALSGRYPGSPW